MAVLADVLGHLEEPVRAAALGVDDPLGHPLAVELRHLLDQVVVLEQDRPVGADGQRMLVARRRDAGVGGGPRWLAHFGGLLARLDAVLTAGPRPTFYVSGIAA